MPVPASSLRIDVLTGRQVIVAPDRGRRPGAVSDDPPLSDPADGNPFLEGQEQRTPNERLALRRQGSRPNQPGWLVRVVPNQFPAVTDTESQHTVESAPVVRQRPVAGFHEVVIESPKPTRRMVEQPAAQTARVLLAWQRRVSELERIPSVRSVTVFRNEGFSAGASLPHVHSQILATSTTSPQMDDRLRRSDEHRRQHRTTLLHDLLSSEIDDGSRVVAADSSCVVICPWAGRVSWQVRIAPLPNVSVPFSACPESLLIDMAARLHAAAQAVDDCAGQRAMNVMLVQPPPDNADDGWFLDLTPRSTRMAGYELATDVDIVTVAPEAAAAALRQSFHHDSLTVGEVIPAGYTWCDHRH